MGKFVFWLKAFLKFSPVKKKTPPKTKFFYFAGKFSRASIKNKIWPWCVFRSGRFGYGFLRFERLGFQAKTKGGFFSQKNIHGGGKYYFYWGQKIIIFLGKGWNFLSPMGWGQNAF